MTTGTIGQNCRIYNLTTGATLPCIKSTNKIIILLSVHAGFTLWASHGITSLLTYLTESDTYFFQNVIRRYYTRHANFKLIIAFKIVLV